MMYRWTSYTEEQERNTRKLAGQKQAETSLLMGTSD